MRNLGDAEIDFIREDIRRRGVFTESLQENLLDHLCCYIEEQPEDDRPFEEVYAQALEAFGHNGLQQVQDETLFIINHSHLNTMKKLMYISGASASILLIAGAFFKINHWPGANVSLLLGTVMLTILFIPSFFYLRFKEQSEKKEKAISAIGMVTVLIMSTGALFKLMHWPYTMILVTSGFGMLFLLFLPLYIINGVRNPITRFSSLSSAFLFACLGGFMLLLSFQQPSRNVMDSYKTIHENETAMLVQLQHEVNGKTTDPAAQKALQDFIAVTNKALDEIPGANPEVKIGNGDAVENDELKTLNQKLNAAIAELNKSLSTQQSWKAISAPALEPAQFGSIRFQVLQLQCRVYSQALSL